MLDFSVLYIVLTVILMILTSAFVTVMRAKTGILFGDGGNDSLARARRSHYTMFEFGVPFLALVIVYDLTGGSGDWIMWLSIVFLVTRLAHVLYIIGLAEQIRYGRLVHLAPMGSRLPCWCCSL